MVPQEGGHMLISAKGRYALRMMVDLAVNHTGEWISLKDVSSRQGISVKYLEQIVTSLTRAGFLRSSRGPQGGYMLAKPASQYTAGSILRAAEGELAPVACLEDPVNLCPRKAFCPTLPFWEGLNKVVNEYLDSKTLQDLVDEQTVHQGWDFSI